MNTANCKTVRRKIDEANLETELESTSLAHLEWCSECRAYYDDQRTLRSLMSGFETVGAPADFDFKLRARLARERTSDQIGVGFNRFPLSRIGAATALVLAAAVGVVLLRSLKSASVTTPTMPAIANRIQQGDAPAAGPVGPSQEMTGQNLPKSEKTEQLVATVGARKNRPVTSKEFPVRHSGTQLAVRDSALTPAANVVPAAPVSSDVVQIPMSSALRVTISNGKGSARTVSLPSVSFGSDRLMAHGSSFAPGSTSRVSW